jgi:hypothetical protein
MRIGAIWGRLVGEAVGIGVSVGVSVGVGVLEGVALGPGVGESVDVGISVIVGGSEVFVMVAVAEGKRATAEGAAVISGRGDVLKEKTFCQTRTPNVRIMAMAMTTIIRRLDSNFAFTSRLPVIR